MRQARQPIQQVARILRRQRGRIGRLRQRPRRQRRRQRHRLAIGTNRQGGIETGSSQPGLDVGRVVLRPDLGDVARLPRRRGASRLEDQVERGRTGAVLIEQPPLDQPPLPVGRRLPVGQLGSAGEVPQVMLPLPQGPGIAVVDFDEIEQRRRAAVTQPAIEPVAERAVLIVATIAEGEHAVADLGQAAL